MLSPGVSMNTKALSKAFNSSLPNGRCWIERLPVPEQYIDFYCVEHYLLIVT